MDTIKSKLIIMLSVAYARPFFWRGYVKQNIPPLSKQFKSLQQI